MKLPKQRKGENPQRYADRLRATLVPPLRAIIEDERYGEELRAKAKRDLEELETMCTRMVLNYRKKG